MADNTQQPTNGAAQPEARPSLREIAEQAWDDVVENAPDDGGESPDQPEPGRSSQNRDSLGRFSSKEEEPGEAAPPEAPSPDDQDSAPQEPESPTQPPQGESSEAPQNWSAQDRQTFAKLPEEAREFLLRRHSDMEGDYQRRVQAVGVAAQFTEAVAPVFQDPVVQGSLKQQGISPVDAIQQWAAMHRRAYHPDPRERVNLLVDIARNVGLDPAAIFATQSRPDAAGPLPGLTEEDLKDPAIRSFADHIGRTSSEVQQLRNAIQQMTQQRQDEVLQVTRMNIDRFADEADAQGNKLRPDFDECLPALMEMVRANPQVDIAQAYNEARWRTPSIRERLVNAAQSSAQQTVQQRQSADRARAAVRTNVRGMTSPVTKPAPTEGAKGLRATLEASADEVGI
jgi:hypothetical protein